MSDERQNRTENDTVLTPDVALLRRAAALMRERAQAATSGAWYDCGPDGGGGVRRREDDFLICMPRPLYGDDGAHIASWHPAVALAVADWLDDLVALREIGTYGALTGWQQALAVARAYLGEDA